jgi:hypothetical protein
MSKNTLKRIPQRFGHLSTYFSGKKQSRVPSGIKNCTSASLKHFIIIWVGKPIKEFQ